MRPWFYKLSRGTARIYFRLWHRWRVIGLEHVPAEGPVLFIANHASYFDPPLVAIANDRYVYSLGRSTLGKLGPAHWILSSCATLFVDREGSARQGIEVAVNALESGQALTVFPEGTRTRTGEVGPFKRGILLILARCPAATVIPVGVRGTFDALPRGAWFPRPARIEVEFGAPMSAAAVQAEGGIDALRNRVVQLVGGPAAGAGGEIDSTTAAADSEKGGDESPPATAEYRVPRSGLEGAGPRSSAAREPSPPRSGGIGRAALPRFSQVPFSTPRFV